MFKPIRVIEASGKRSFEKACNALVADGYTLSSSACGGSNERDGYVYQAIFVLSGPRVPGNLFNIGDKVKTRNLVDDPSCNGMTFTIKTCRTFKPNKYCPSGILYYVVEPIPWGDDYIYQEKLRLVEN